MTSDNLFILAALIGAFLILVLKALFAKNDSPFWASGPEKLNKPTHPEKNDKVMVVDNVRPDQLKEAIVLFCNLYNREWYAVLPRLAVISSIRCAVTFPYDIEFEIFCYFINYLYYAENLGYTPRVYGWTTVKQGEWELPESLVDKKVMIYIPVDDTEHDNVYLTTSENKGYKFRLGTGENIQPIGNPVEHYIKPTVNTESLSGLETMDFE